MKNKVLLLSFLWVALACGEKKSEASNQVFGVFGDSIQSENALTASEMYTKYKSLQKGDTLSIKFKTTINEICQNKGCWMTLDLGNKEQAFVKFKDYGFFVPMNAQKREVVVEGKAFIEETPVAELKHYAEDEGKSKAAIDSIVAPKIEYKFLAHGVLIAK